VQIPEENRVIVLTIDSVSREKFKHVMHKTFKTMRRLQKEGKTDIFGFERYHTVGTACFLLTLSLLLSMTIYFPFFPSLVPPQA